MDARCPRKLSKLPDTPCQEGLRAVRCARKGKDGGCPWFVADAESCYCLWKFLANEGKARETDVAKITRLLMMNDESEVKQIIREKAKQVAEELT